MEGSKKNLEKRRESLRSEARGSASEDESEGSRKNTSAFSPKDFLVAKMGDGRTIFLPILAHLLRGNSGE